RDRRAPRRCDLSHRRAAREAARRQQRCARLRPRRTRAAPARDAVERHRARSAVANFSRPHLRDRAAHPGRQDAGGRRHPRCALADPPDRTVATLHARDLLCPDHPLALGAGRAFPHRSADRARVHAALMKTATPIDRYLARYPGLASLAYGLAIVLLLFV